MVPPSQIPYMYVCVYVFIYVKKHLWRFGVKMMSETLSMKAEIRDLPDLNMNNMA